MPDLEIERSFHEQGNQTVCGIDEAGRGPLAGPVAAAAVILPEGYEHPTLNDSKKLTHLRREALYEEITTNPSIRWASALVDAKTIDEINILQATWLAMRTALAGLQSDGDEVDVALIDGKPVKDFPIPHRGVIKGDSLSLSIAAASIIAKVERDRLMIEYHERWPAYGFAKHKGYGTKQHLTALAEHGPCEIHRQSFAPVRDAS